MNLNIPEGYMLTLGSNNEDPFYQGKMVSIFNREIFNTTNRSFDVVNALLDERISALIELSLDLKKGSKVSVLDFGGGRFLRSAKDIAERYPQAQVFGVDLLADPSETKDNFTALRGDVCKGVAIPTGVIDVLYSHQVLPYLDHTKYRVGLDGERPLTRKMQAILEIGRMMSSDSVALLHDYRTDITEFATLLKDANILELTPNLFFVAVGSGANLYGPMEELAAYKRLKKS